MSGTKLIVTVKEDGSNIKDVERLIKEAVKAGQLAGVSFAESVKLGRPRNDEPAGPPFPARLTKEQHAGIARIAKKEKTSRTAVIRRAVSELLDREKILEKSSADG